MNRKTIIVVLICIVLITGCGVTRDVLKGEIEEKNLPDKLVVYLSAAPHGFQTADDPSGENIQYLYPSKYIYGTRMVGGELDCADGNIFAQALKEYSEKTGIEIEIHYVEEFNDGGDVFQVLADKNELPDLILLNKHSRYDYYRLAQQGYFLDFSVLMDEELLDETQYYRKVIDGGYVDGKQVILPILFNLNGMITSTTYLEQIGCEELTGNLTYEECIFLLQESCLKMSNMQIKEAIFEASGLMLGGQYIPSILIGAGYTSYFSHDLESLEMTEHTVSDILELMKLYNQQEFCVNPDWESCTYLENLNNLEIKSRTLISLTKETYNQIGIFLSGGRSGGINFHNSLLTDASYFNSMYAQTGEEMVLYGIPTVNGSELYSGNISVLAAGFNSTKYPEAVYELIRYMMDYEYPAAYGFSVNKSITEKQLMDIQKNTTCLYSDTIWSYVTAGIKTQSDIEGEAEIIKPLDSYYVEKIRFMLNHMDGAGLPFGVLEYYVFQGALDNIVDKDQTCEETAMWVVDTLEEYLRCYDTLNPFYDQYYIESLVR